MTTAHRSDRLAWEAVADVAALIGVVPGPPTPALGSTNHVYLVDEPPLVFNVAAPERDPAELGDRIAAARILADLGVFARLFAEVEQPSLSRTGRLVTVWERVDTLQAEPDWAAVGRLLRRIGEVPSSRIGSLGSRLKVADDLSDVAGMIDHLTSDGRLRAPDAEMLQRIRGRLSDELAAGGDARERVLVHGDLWRPNVLVTPSGPLFCDADEVGVGPPDWDIAALLDWRRPTAIGPNRAALLEGWGRDLPRRERVRSLMRAAHLRRTLKRLSREERTPRDGYWNLVRLGAWQQVDRNWNYDGFPELHQSRQEQVRNVLERTRQFSGARFRSSRTSAPSSGSRAGL